MLDFFDYISKTSESKEILNGVFHKEGKVYACNKKVFICCKADYMKENELCTYDKDGYLISKDTDDTIYKNLLKTFDFAKSVEVTDSLFSPLLASQNVLKKYKALGEPLLSVSAYLGLANNTPVFIGKDILDLIVPFLKEYPNTQIFVSKYFDGNGSLFFQSVDDFTGEVVAQMLAMPISHFFFLKSRKDDETPMNAVCYDCTTSQIKVLLTLEGKRKLEYSFKDKKREKEFDYRKQLIAESEKFTYIDA